MGNECIKYARFRDEYKRRESYSIRLEQKRLGGIFSWFGASDEKIYEAFIKKEHDYPSTHEQFLTTLK